MATSYRGRYIPQRRPGVEEVKVGYFADVVNLRSGEKITYQIEEIYPNEWHLVEFGDMADPRYGVLFRQNGRYMIQGSDDPYRVTFLPTKPLSEEYIPKNLPPIRTVTSPTQPRSVFPTTISPTKPRRLSRESDWSGIYQNMPSMRESQQSPRPRLPYSSEYRPSINTPPEAIPASAAGISSRMMSSRQPIIRQRPTVRFSDLNQRFVDSGPASPPKPVLRLEYIIRLHNL